MIAINKTLYHIIFLILRSFDLSFQHPQAEASAWMGGLSPTKQNSDFWSNRYRGMFFNGQEHWHKDYCLHYYWNRDTGDSLWDPCGPFWDQGNDFQEKGMNEFSSNPQSSKNLPLSLSLCLHAHIYSIYKIQGCIMVLSDFRFFNVVSWRFLFLLTHSFKRRC